MSTIVHLPAELAHRLAAEAAGEGSASTRSPPKRSPPCFPDVACDPGRDALEAFIGSGSSGRREPFDIHKARAEPAERKLAEGA